MKIIDYIIKGGENLATPAIKTASFPHNAERLFMHWYKFLGQKDSEPENYIEMPVDSGNRLYIKAFWIETSGNRPVCYYVGILLPKTIFTSAGEYYRVNRGLANIKLDVIREAGKSLSPIQLYADWADNITAIWTSYENLRMALYGSDEYDYNIKKMCSAISVSNIDDWFYRLFIAVNPYRLHPEYYLIVSREKPRPSLADSVSLPRPKKTFTLDNIFKNIKLLWIIIVFLCFVIVYMWFSNENLCKNNEYLLEEHGNHQQDNYMPAQDNNVPILDQYKSEGEMSS